MDEVTWKQQLRVRGLTRRREQSDKDELSRQILARLVALPEYSAARTVMSYVSLSDEVHTEPLLSGAWEEGRRVVVPYCVGNSLRLFVLKSMEELAPGTLGILEPRPELRARTDRVADPAELDLIVVPGVVFDRRGGRIGYGKGYYDGLLTRCKGTVPFSWNENWDSPRVICRPPLNRVRPTAALVALAFECQVVERVPMVAHDVPMQKVLTEQTIYVGPTSV